MDLSGFVFGSKGHPQIQGLTVHIQKIRRDPVLQNLHNGLGPYQFSHTDQRAQHRNVKYDRLADFFHDLVVYGNFFLLGIDFFMGFYIAVIGDQQSARSNYFVKFIICLLYTSDAADDLQPV